MRKNKQLFQSFSPSNKKDWENRVNAELKNIKALDDLFSKTDEGIMLKGLYTQEDIVDEKTMNLPPICNSFEARHWENRALIKVENEASNNQIALNALQFGADGLIFDCRNKKKINFELLLSSIEPAHCSISFITNDHSDFITHFKSWLNKKKLTLSGLSGSLNINLFANIIEKGQNALRALGELKNEIDAIEKDSPFRLICINAHKFPNAGANAVQELAFTLSEANACIAHLYALGLTPSKTISQMEFWMSSGSNFFMEIAKIRALRYLFGGIAQTWLNHNYPLSSIKIHVQSGTWNKPNIEPWNNLLRATTESMAAALGSCDSICTNPRHLPNPFNNFFSQRIALNVSNIIKEEAHLNKVADPVAGAYYIESLTHEMAEKAWELFQKIESMGGYTNALQNEFISNEIQQSSTKKTKDFNQRKTVLTGVNQYANPNIDGYLNSSKEANAQGSLSADFEKLAIKATTFFQKNHHWPLIDYILLSDNNTSRKRLAFCEDLAGSGGFVKGQETILKNGEILDNNPRMNKLIIICGSDEDYANTAIQLTNKLKKKYPHAFISIAGYPREIAASLQNAGVEMFIHQNADIVRLLDELQKQAGIK
jgi:methylmalonyl-CoA mutase